MDTHNPGTKMGAGHGLLVSESGISVGCIASTRPLHSLQQRTPFFATFYCANRLAFDDGHAGSRLSRRAVDGPVDTTKVLRLRIALRPICCDCDVRHKFLKPLHIFSRYPSPFHHNRLQGR
jgi:hypothetical protein